MQSPVVLAAWFAPHSTRLVLRWISPHWSPPLHAGNRSFSDPATTPSCRLHPASCRLPQRYTGSATALGRAISGGDCLLQPTNAVTSRNWWQTVPLVQPEYGQSSAHCRCSTSGRLPLHRPTGLPLSTR